MFNFFAKHKTAEQQQRAHNKQVLETLVRDGSKLEKEHLVELAFAGDWKKMNSLKENLLKEGYEQVLNQTDQMLVVSKWQKINLEEINKLTDRMEKLAIKRQVVFDGWSTYPVK